MLNNLEQYLINEKIHFKTRQAGGSSEIYLFDYQSAIKLMKHIYLKHRRLYKILSGFDGVKGLKSKILINTNNFDEITSYYISWLNDKEAALNAPKKKNNNMLVLFDDDITKAAEEHKEQIQEYAEEDHINLYEKNNLYDVAAVFLDEDLQEIKSALYNYDNLVFFEKIKIVATIQTWRKSYDVYCFYRGSLEEAVTKLFEDHNKIYFKTKNSTLRLSASHHDGTNNFKFYAVFKDGRTKAIKYNDLIGCMF